MTCDFPGDLLFAAFEDLLAWQKQVLVKDWNAKVTADAWTSSGEPQHSASGSQTVEGEQDS